MVVEVWSGREQTQVTKFVSVPGPVQSCRKELIPFIFFWGGHDFKPERWATKLINPAIEYSRQ